MSIHHHGQRCLRLMALIAGLAMLGAVALPSQAAPPAAWRALFPPAAAYPHGTHLLPVQAASQATRLVDPATAAQVVRLGFVAGGVQEAVLPAQAAASVTVLTFRTTRGAATFLRQDQPPALGDPSTAGETITGLGDGARYLTGSSEGCCGPAAPPLGILLLRQGTAVVQILTQPADRDLALRLGHAALRH
jgi:hypothetical protein